MQGANWLYIRVILINYVHHKSPSLPVFLSHCLTICPSSLHLKGTMSSTPKSIGENINPSVQNLVDKQLTSIPSQYAYFKNPSDSTALPGDGIPVIDYSLLISEDPDHRAKCIRELGKACREWGSFLVYIDVLHDSMSYYAP